MTPPPPVVFRSELPALSSRCDLRSRGIVGIAGMDGRATGVEPTSEMPGVHEGSTWLTAAEIAATFKVDRSTVYRWARARALPSMKICGTRRFERSAVEAALRGAL
jgi:excisionase family DNA binding protein